MDKLKQCALAYERLFNIKYHFEIGRKGKLVSFDILFSKDDFHHLAGLHKLKDNDKIRTGKREKIFDEIINDKIKLSDIEKSAFFNDMQNRIAPLTDLENMLDSNELVFRFNKNQDPYTRIDADYILECNDDNDIVYTFLRNDNNENVMKCISLFPKGLKDYTLRQPRYTLLKKQKIDLTTNTVLLDYKR